MGLILPATLLFTFVSAAAVADTPTTAAHAADASQPKLTRKEITAVDAFIKTQERVRSKKDPAHNRLEYRDARRYAVGDANHDRVSDVVVQYTLEEDNNWVLFLAVFSRPTMRHLAHTRVGGKNHRTVDLRKVSDGTIELVTQNYSPADASCCPSVPGKSLYMLTDGALEEIDAVIECSGSRPPQ